MRSRNFHLRPGTYLGIISVLLLVAVALFWKPSEPESPQKSNLAENVDSDAESIQRQLRLMELRQLRPGASDQELVELMEQSDDAQRQIDEYGDVTMHDHIHTSLRDVTVSQEEMLSYYNDNLDLFGNRSLAESAETIDRLIRIQKVRGELTSQ